jgi:hypothetical protein
MKISWAIGERVEKAQGGGRGRIAIIQERSDLATMRGGKEKYSINSG